jgi:outer membrane protein TolC
MTGSSAMSAFMLMALLSGPVSVSAQAPPPIDLTSLGQGPPALPVIWAPYRPMPLPPVDLRNGSLLEQRIGEGRIRLSLHDFLQLVVENDLDLQAARYDVAIAQVDLLRAQSGQAARGTASAPLPDALFAGAIGAGVSSTAGLSSGGTGGAAITTQGKLVAFGPRGNFDPTLSLNLSYDRLVNPLNTARVAGLGAVTVPTTVLLTRFQQELPYGTSYSVSLNLQRQASTQQGLLFNPALTSFVALQVYQPLLNGFGLALTQRFVTLADNNRKIVREAFHTTLDDRLSAAANAYWDLVASREYLGVAQQAVATAQQQDDEDHQRVRVGVMAPIDVLSADSQRASARAQLVTAQTQLQQQQLIVKTYMSRMSDRTLDAAVIEPTDALPDPVDVDMPPLSRSIETALASRSSIRQAELSLENQRIAEQYTRKNLLPTFSVYAAINLYGLAPGTDPAVRQLVQWAFPEYSAGFTWSLPLFNRAAQADDVRARFSIQETEAALQRTRSQITTQVQTATVSVTRDRAQVQAAQRAVLASRQAFEGEQKKLSYVISTPYRVTLAQRDLIAAQVADIQARVDYAKALVAHQMAVGDFLERHGIVADDARRGNLLREYQAPETR